MPSSLRSNTQSGPAGRSAVSTAFIGCTKAGRDLVADPDLAVAEHVGAQAALVDQRLQRAGLSRRGGQALQVRAGLAQALTEALDAADSEMPSHQGVEVDAAGDDVAAGLGRRERSRRQ